MKQLRKDLRDAFNRHAMAEHELKTQLRAFSTGIRTLGKDLRKQFNVPAGGWLVTKRISCADGPAGLGLSCSFSSTDQRMIEKISEELKARGWIVYDTSIFLQHTEIKAY